MTLALVLQPEVRVTKQFRDAGYGEALLGPLVLPTLMARIRVRGHAKRPQSGQCMLLGNTHHRILLDYYVCKHPIAYNLNSPVLGYM